MQQKAQPSTPAVPKGDQKPLNYTKKRAQSQAEQATLRAD
jgi:hypothetical protein